MRILPASALMAFALASCGQPKQLSVDHVWVRLPAVPDRPAAAYFTVHGGPKDATLIAVSSDYAVETQMHETMTKNGTNSMQPVKSVSVPAHGTVAFAPGGRHAMMYTINPIVKPGKTMPVTFTFGDGTRILVNAPAIAAGDPAPKG